MASSVGSLSREVIVGVYRLTGALPETATCRHARGTMFPDGVPEWLMDECRRERAAFVAAGEGNYVEMGDRLR